MICPLRPVPTRTLHYSIRRFDGRGSYIPDLFRFISFSISTAKKTNEEYIVIISSQNVNGSVLNIGFNRGA